MILRLFVLLFVCFFALSGCDSRIGSGNNEKNPETGAGNQAIPRRMSGKLDGKYEIVMNLESNGESIEGTYYYTKVGKEIRLKGVRKNEGTILLEEFPKAGQKTGEFKGKITANGFDGTWNDAEGK